MSMSDACVRACVRACVCVCVCVCVRVCVTVLSFLYNCHSLEMFQVKIVRFNPEMCFYFPSSWVLEIPGRHFAPPYPTLIRKK